MRAFFNIFKTSFIGVSLLFCHWCYGQSDQQAALLKFTASSDSLISRNGAEKLYIQFDKPYYVLRDTIWLKAYLFNAPTDLLSSRSGLLHVDIADDSSKIVKQYLLPVWNGLSWGNITLDDKIFKPGDYILRAYTSWMRNFGEDIFFFKRIRIAGTNENRWLVNSRIDKKGINISAQLQLTAMDKSPLADSILQAELKDGKRVFVRQNVKTDKNGLLSLNFSPPPGSGKPDIILHNKNKTKNVIIPVVLDDPEKIDVQFMPEGGSLVAGLPARIGFKAIGEDGRGVAISGVIADHRDSIVALFKTLHNGIGSFFMQAAAGEIYRAKVILPGGTVKSYPLPVVKASGTLLQVKNIPGSDSLEVVVGASRDMAGTYYLAGKGRGVICYAAVAGLGKEPVTRSRIAKNRFPQGIAHFILMTTGGQPLNERLVYIDRADSLHIDIQPDHQAYNPKDSIALHISVSDNAGNPITGNFSMAVTDDAQVHGDSLYNDNILSRMLLTSELKGYVEGPDYYFRNNEAAKQALDNLLLTQGWVNYDPPAGMPYKPEKEFTVQGMVNNLFRAPVKKTHVVLFSRSPALLFDTVTNNEGRFIFDRFPKVDTPVFVLKAVNRAGKSFNVNIGIDEYKTPAFEAPKMPFAIPWYVNTDTTLVNQVKNNIQMKQAGVPGGGQLLKEVQIKAKKVVKGSYNPNGPGGADIIMDEKDVEVAGKKTLMQLCEEKIPGFHEIIVVKPDGSPDLVYRVNYKHAVFIVNGQVLLHVLPAAYRVKDFLIVHNAEDIKGLEVAKSSKYIGAYERMYYASQIIDPDTLAFIEITTRSGDFAMPITPGVYLYKPLAINWPKQFYKPKYTIKDTTKQTDLRSTIDWEPNIATDSAGHATVSFYAGSLPSTYTVIVEGTDLKGNMAYRRITVTVFNTSANKK